MASIKKIITLVKKDLLLEIRQQYAFYGVVLYVGATTFVLYMTIDNPEPAIWNGLFWIIQLFISINAVAKSFLQESKSRMAYYQSITGSLNFVYAKLVFNTALMLVMSILSLILFALSMSFPVVQSLRFFGIVLLGSCSLSLVFTFIAAIAAKAQQNAAIMAILGFPIIIPQLIVLVQISQTVFVSRSALPLANILLLVASDIMVIILASVLFPFLWKD